MNILAHLYLSRGINDLMLGNYMGDFVKGKQYKNYPEPIQQGIILHRKIDDYTDRHPLHRKTRERIRSKYRLHSGIVVDIIYDHYLATNWQNFHNTPLTEYAQLVYRFIESKYSYLPKRLSEFTPFMITNNWLVSYKHPEGIERVLNGMARRTSLPAESAFALKILKEQYTAIQEEFNVFFSDLEKNIVI